jgi:hypothetical protein
VALVALRQSIVSEPVSRFGAEARAGQATRCSNGSYHTGASALVDRLVGDFAVETDSG